MNPSTSTPILIPVPGRGWAISGMLLGGLVSIAANIAHSYIPPLGAPTGWTPPFLSVALAVVWPVFLFWAVEILVRTPWPTRAGWALVRWAGLLPVALVAAFVSYRHLSGLLDHYGEEPIVTILGPIAVDGLMIMATAALMAANHHTRTHQRQSTMDTGAEAGPAVDTLVDQRPEPVEPPPAPAPTAGAPVATREPVTVPAHLVPTARFAVTNHQQTTGRTITADELSARMSIDPTTAGNLLTHLHTTTPPSVNGAVVGEVTR